MSRTLVVEHGDTKRLIDCVDILVRCCYLLNHVQSFAGGVELSSDRSMAQNRLQSAMLEGAVVMASAWLLRVSDRISVDSMRTMCFMQLRVLDQVILVGVVHWTSRRSR